MYTVLGVFTPSAISVTSHSGNPVPEGTQNTGTTQPQPKLLPRCLRTTCLSSMFRSDRTMHGPSGDSESPEGGSWEHGLKRRTSEGASPERPPRIRHHQHRHIHQTRERERGQAPSGQAHTTPKGRKDGTQGEGKGKRR